MNYFIQLNNNEDLIISRSDDKTIKFQVKTNLWICSQTILDHTKSVCRLSLNDEQNKVISFFEWIIQYQQYNSYHKISNGMLYQDINEQYKQIVFKDNRYFCENLVIIVNYTFLNNIQSKCLLVNKNGCNINLIKKNNNEELKIFQLDR
ncbi:unnamed protein product [Paramecium octaurelia]|uniref:Uncharacterized protein n=1 Tax=Paramecium octaurelia TaxID=43137 RepID=A0A8S1XQ24_PAROT|nr:unnamed protein product [Paramecium octaurelia]